MCVLMGGCICFRVCVNASALCVCVGELLVALSLLVHKSMNVHVNKSVAAVFVHTPSSCARFQFTDIMLLQMHFNAFM